MLLNLSWLLPLGNDIIDLTVASQHRPEYFERLSRTSFFKRELQLKTSLDKLISLWLLWSLKEAAYKYVVQETWLDGRFVPKEFEILQIERMNESFVGYVDFLGRKVKIYSILNEHYVHSLALNIDLENVSSAIFELPEANYQSQSREIREVVLTNFVSSECEPGDSISISKDDQEVPYFARNGERLPFDLTLSHHGCFGAYAYCSQ